MKPRASWEDWSRAVSVLESAAAGASAMAEIEDNRSDARDMIEGAAALYRVVETLRASAIDTTARAFGRFGFLAGGLFGAAWGFGSPGWLVHAAAALVYGALAWAACWAAARSVAGLFFAPDWPTLPRAPPD